ncbi:MAG TPA: undecaprenyldiphospho-muramoylpentapeptide beta-N-acetylglucosaminyltransferase [Balneolaceae bacterium]|nr:undecaprenyldiphospho-muramoylpentapeptide beta-N-acetylglucosaminyltransferase [Balneolaceae bacterium]|tara:strand:- start:26540 stop:27637 length:1098 start_codon:yes stop_codon:yes gene_type:complete
MAKKRILIAAGGTGGHVYPAIAIADALKAADPETEIMFVGTRDHMEWEAVPKAGYEICNVWISGFHRRLTLKNLLFPIKLITSVFQSFGIIRNFKPQVMVSCGGYVAGPVGWVASKTGVKVVIQEQNSFPGVTNRMLAKSAKKIFTAFKEAENYLPADKITLTGNPTRGTLAQVSKEEGQNSFTFELFKPTLLIMGGSGGAKTINDAVRKNLDVLHDNAGLQIIWQCGSRYYDALAEEIETEDYPNLRLMAFIHNMPEAYAAADLVVSRAGASSCSEFMILGKPSVLIPSPNVAGDHQTQNARSMAEAGASELLPDKDAVDALPELVTRLISDQEKLQKMNIAAQSLAKPNAAHVIANEILELAN